MVEARKRAAVEAGNKRRNTGGCGSAGEVDSSATIPRADRNWVCVSIAVVAVLAVFLSSSSYAIPSNLWTSNGDESHPQGVISYEGIIGGGGGQLWLFSCVPGPQPCSHFCSYWSCCCSRAILYESCCAHGSGGKRRSVTDQCEALYVSSVPSIVHTTAEPLQPKLKRLLLSGSARCIYEYIDYSRQ